MQPALVGFIVFLVVVRWVMRRQLRIQVEAQLLRALDGVGQAERHLLACLDQPNPPKAVEVQLVFLAIERWELNAMLARVRAGEKVDYEGIYRLQKLVLGQLPEPISNPLSDAQSRA